MAEIDFDKVFGQMSIPTAEGDPIKSIYEIIPSMDSVQMHLKFQLMYFVEKYDLPEWKAVFGEIDQQLCVNKNISFMSSQNLRALLSAYTQNELLRGIKIQSMNNVNGGDK
ncbi:MAG: hypothetical protein PHV18_14165 [Lachnospiraceae bacterium]|nr:hypothetical protein [Lachnospiraceae bacterium]